MTRETGKTGKTFSTFLAKGYLSKGIADYGMGDGANITMTEANAAIEIAGQFIGFATALLA